MKDINMAAFKRINITLHPEDLRKLDRIAEKRNHTRSGMISRLVQEYNEKSLNVDFADVLEDSSVYHAQHKKNKGKDKVR